MEPEKPIRECTDGELLRRFAKGRAEEDFGQLVERYLGMVFAVALRRCRDREMAEEVAQNVFAVLARKAPSLQSKDACARRLRVSWGDSFACAA